MISPSEALEKLRLGNQRYVSGELTLSEQIGSYRHSDRQSPFAIVLGCSDSRVPSEIVFDQGLGDLFIVRVAGNVAGPTQVGSIEFAAEQFGTRLVIVLGHSQCGAVQATLGDLKSGAGEGSPNLRSIVDQISPGVRTVFEEAGKGDPAELLSKAVRANIQASVEKLKKNSFSINQLMKKDGLQIVGAEYSLATRTVEFFEGLEGKA